MKGKHMLPANASMLLFRFIHAKI